MVSVSMQTAILVVIAIALAFAAALMFFTYAGTFYGKSTEAIMVMADSYINKSGDELYLHLYVTLRPYAEIYRIEVGGKFIDLDSVEIYKVESGRAEKVDNIVKVWGGSSVWLRIRLGVGNIPALLNTVEVKVYTRQGYVYRGMVRVLG